MCTCVCFPHGGQACHMVPDNQTYGRLWLHCCWKRHSFVRTLRQLSMWGRLWSFFNSVSLASFSGGHQSFSCNLHCWQSHVKLGVSWHVWPPWPSHHYKFRVLSFYQLLWWASELFWVYHQGFWWKWRFILCCFILWHHTFVLTEDVHAKHF
jgi:hypothetical protein